MFLFQTVLFIYFVLINSDDNGLDKINLFCSVKRNIGEECHTKEIPDDIPSIDERQKEFADGAIFFIDTSCNGVLSLAHACSVEAAAKLHPDREVNVLFSGPVNTRCLTVSPSWKILNYPNINIYRVHLDSYIVETPLQMLPESKQRFPMSRLHDIIKYLTLYKYGGVYVDLNVLLVRSIDLLPEPRNWVGKTGLKTLGDGCLALMKQGVGRLIAEGILRLYRTYFETINWRLSSTQTLTRVLQKLCRTPDVTMMTAESCGGFEVYDPFYFDPVQAGAWNYFFSSSYNKFPYEPYAFHIRNNTLDRDDIGNPLVNLRANHCPRIMSIRV